MEEGERFGSTLDSSDSDSSSDEDYIKLDNANSSAPSAGAAVVVEGAEKTRAMASHLLLILTDDACCGTWAKLTIAGDKQAVT
jgi:hypothetical protein